MAAKGKRYCDSCSACEQESTCKRDQDQIASNEWAYESQCSWWAVYVKRVLLPEMIHEQEMGY
jgi:hypothetical protein